MKKMNKKAVDGIMEKALRQGVFPGAVIGIAKGLGTKREKVVSSYGYASLLPQQVEMEKDIFFDLASLTKPLATTLAILGLIKERKLSLDEPLSSLLERCVPQDKKNITLRQLLGHCSGLPAWQPYFKELINWPPGVRWKKLVKWILQESLAYPVGSRTLYSDLGFMILGRIVEKKSGMKLSDYVKEKIYRSMGIEKSLFFRPLSNKSKKERLQNERFAATEDIAWRGGVTCGTVHDENCYMLGGVCGHAGLFGNVKGVLKLTTAILDQWQGVEEHPNYDNRDLRQILARQKEIGENTWALGFDTRSKKGSSSGRYLSTKSAGHLGFTGTSFWIDPVKHLVIVLLTNRVHPRRDNNMIKDFRPIFHNMVVEKLIKLSK